MQRMWVRSLAGKLRSYMLHGVAKIINYLKISFFYPLRDQGNLRFKGLQMSSKMLSPDNHERRPNTILLIKPHGTGSEIQTLPIY